MKSKVSTSTLSSTSIPPSWSSSIIWWMLRRASKLKRSASLMHGGDTTVQGSAWVGKAIIIHLIILLNLSQNNFHLHRYLSWSLRAFQSFGSHSIIYNVHKINIESLGYLTVSFVHLVVITISQKIPCSNNSKLHVHPLGITVFCLKMVNSPEVKYNKS